jgi:hypothetical protein
LTDRKWRRTLSIRLCCTSFSADAIARYWDTTAHAAVLELEERDRAELARLIS